MHKWLFALLILSFIPGPLWAQPVSSTPNYIHQYMPQARIVGQGRLNYLVWNIYDAKLYAPKGQYKPNKPFALTMHYLRDIKGEEIADRTIEEIRHQGFSDEVVLAVWHEQLKIIFPDVYPGTVLTGIHKDNGTTLLLKNGSVIGKITDPEFGYYFFNIWLGKNTKAPQLRRELLGNNA